ncbi:excinuclease ABC subunit UvrC [bacterium]|nr:excinuclease ABC subunit UvrC [bacterium]
MSSYPKAEMNPEEQKHLDELLSACPADPGVYLMKDCDGHIIYVGKAKVLKNRVRSYFQRIEAANIKTQHLVSKIRDMEFLRTGTEVEALLLENTLIKKHKPKYNIRLKDDKTYPYLRLDVAHDYPRPYIARKQLKSDSAEFFGPFPHGNAVWKIMQIAAKVFKIRDCRDHEFANRSRPCLSYEIGQCTAPCVKKVSKAEYASQINEFKVFLKGNNQAAAERWEAEMSEAAENMEYERAAELRDRIRLMEDILGDEQSVVDTEDLRDKDVWAIWPEPFVKNVRVEATEDWEDGEAVDVMVLQFREGKLVGRLHWGAELQDVAETDEVLASTLVQHYQKNPLPELLILPPQSTELPLADLTMALSDEKTDGNLQLAWADEKKSWWAAFELAQDNVKGWYQEKKEQRMKSADTLGKLKKFLALPRLPRHMECIDISNFQGSANVASCVVFKDGKPFKDEYRKYNIKTVDGQDDFKSMQELVSRRYLKPGAKMPDLLVVDGGRGQLSSVCKILDEFELGFPVISLAKARTQSDFKSEEVGSTEERIFLPGQKNHKKIRDQGVWKLLTHIRDEAHRFAISFNRKKMRERLIDSAMDDGD